ncbi:MAG: flagellar hook protein FlgE [Selenomonadaceae bacterium]|nr:flagellar hook protein FlgE [Selenomonadaceae bacterium]
MMRSLFSGVSGLKSHQTRMDVIGNNIANVNTIGFKSSRTTFSDMLSQLQNAASAPTDNRGGINPKQIGLGAAVESIDLIFNDSSPQQTGKNTDLALSGNALFVLKNGDQTYYTRNGAFEFDEAGNYVLPGSGLRVQGWNADDDGNINTNSLSTDIVVPVGKTMEASATTTVDYAGNLNKESLLIDKITYTAGPTGSGADSTKVVVMDGTNVKSVNVDGVNVIAATITLKNGDTQIVTSGYYEVNHSIPVTTLATIYDSLGGKHEITMLVDRAPSDSDTPTEPNALATVTDSTTSPPTYDNRWRSYIAPGVGEQGPTGTGAGTTITTTEADGTTMTATLSEIQYLYFNDKGHYVSNGILEDEGSITFNYSDGNGAAENSATLYYTGLTQYANNTTAFPTTNGYTSGVLQSLSVDSNGIITGTYTNGLIRSEGQVAVAQFANASGLTKIGTTIYQESNNSGAANIRTMSDLGVSVVAAALEMSNVDLANEFADMIITQRGFQANSKMTTVADEMLETVVNMKR